MADDRPLHEVLFEYAVYVPIGIAASVAEQLPELTEKGRRLAGTRIHMAKLMGEFAVGHAQRRFGRILSSNGREPGHTQDTSPRADSRSAPTEGPPSRHGPESVADVGGEASPGLQARRETARLSDTEPGAPEPTSTSKVAGERPRRTRRTAPAGAGEAIVAEPIVPAAQSAVPLVESLAIPAYDTLAASQVVQRLSSLEPDELEAVRRYELGTRGRRTILHRVAQLNAAGGRTPG